MKTTKEERKQLIDAIDDGADDEMGYVPIANDLVRDLVDDVDELEEALRELVERMDLIHDNEEYKGVWVLHMVHGGEYSGPTYEAELDKARDVLTSRLVRIG